MEEMVKHGALCVAAMMAGMDRKTAAKYVEAGKLPSEMKKARDWRTREDPFAEQWPEIEQLLRDTPALEAKTVFAVLQEKYPGRYEDGQLRTLQRHIQRWRAEHGPDKEVVLAQRHRPGEAIQTDFTSTKELGVMIAGEVFEHLLCVSTLPFSNWQWATVCLSESLAALRRGVQRVLFCLGRIPAFHQTDNSTAATHRIPDGKSAVLEDGRRPFNEDYQFLADLTVHIARPYQRIVNYHGRFSNRSRGYRKKHLAVSCPTDPEVPCVKPTSPRKASWARLIQKVYEVDPLVCPCGGRLRPIALIDDPDVIHRILDHCGLLETEPDARAARAPPHELLYIPVDPDAF